MATALSSTSTAVCVIGMCWRVENEEPGKCQGRCYEMCVDAVRYNARVRFQGVAVRYHGGVVKCWEGAVRCQGGYCEVSEGAAYLPTVPLSAGKSRF